MNILITGGTGFLGTYLCNFLYDKSHKITILSRNTKHKLVNKNISLINNLNSTTDYYDIIINLAGESLANKRWNDKVKHELVNSRVNTTKQIIEFIENAKKKPQLLISGSAIGYYGHSDKTIFTENSTATETNSLAYEICSKWESEAIQAIDYGVRTAIIRTGIVLEKKHGALAKMMLSFKLGLGAIISPGTQFMSWIHIYDFIMAINHIIDNKNISGIFNLCSPHPVTNKEFSETLSKTLNKPCFLTMPNFILKIILGDMAEELLIKGQYVFPKNLLDTGFKFKFNLLDNALKDLLL
jgi:uncharacterized protein